MINKIPDGATHRDEYYDYFSVDKEYIKLWDGYEWVFFDYACDIDDYEFIKL